MTIIDHNVVIQCSECKGKMLRIDYVSGNSFGSTRWSNGKNSGSMLMNSDSLFRCAHCEAIFWIGDAVEVGRTEPDYMNWLGEDPASDIFHPEWKSLPSPDNVMDIGGFYEAIRQLPEGSALWKEEYARTQVWWWHEQPSLVVLMARRRGESPTPELDRDNLWRLLELVDASKDEGRLKRAGIMLSLKRFSEAAEVLDAITDKELLGFRDQLKDAAVNGRSEVFKLR